jgi:hypothetical protein
VVVTGSNRPNGLLILENMPSPALLLLFSTALLAAGIVWPMAAKAGRRRNLATGGRRRIDLDPVHYAGPAALIATSAALQLTANFL